MVSARRDQKKGRTGGLTEEQKQVRGPTPSPRWTAVWPGHMAVNNSFFGFHEAYFDVFHGLLRACRKFARPSISLTLMGPAPSMPRWEKVLEDFSSLILC